MITREGVKSIAVPPLGCGNGGLEWADVQPLMAEYLSGLDVAVSIYPPNGAPAPAAMPAQDSVPGMTLHRAAMLAIFDRYLAPGYTLGRLEAQKLLYFLKVAGAPFDRIVFTKGEFGPYADGIRHVLNTVEGHFIRGFGDADGPSEITVMQSATHEAYSMLCQADDQVFSHAVEQVADMIKGFDDPFGLELLASVHWLANDASNPVSTPDDALDALHEWNPRKRQRYDSFHVRAAWNRLAAEGLVAQAATEPAPTPPRIADRVPVPDGDLVDSAL